MFSRLLKREEFGNRLAGKWLTDCCRCSAVGMLWANEPRMAVPKPAIPAWKIIPRRGAPGNEGTPRTKAPYNHKTTMPQEQSSTASKSRRPRNRRPGYQKNRAARPEQPAPAAKKPSFWQKITRLFSGETEANAAKDPYGSSPKPARPRDSGRPSGPKPDRKPRKPEAVEVTSPRLYVGNLSFDAVESDLQELFSGAGAVANVEIVINRHTQRSKGFGFVQMQTIEEALRAVEALHDKEYMGRKLVVSGAKAADERRDERNRTSEAA